MNAADVTWAIGRPTIGTAVKLVARLKVYGKERVPLDGGIVVASNHFHWLDPPALGAACPRVLYYMAKIEAHRAPGLGSVHPRVRLLPRPARRVRPRGRAHDAPDRRARARRSGCSSRARASDRGVPGEVQPGAAMVALQEDVPVVPVAIHGTQTWRLGSRQPVSIAWGEPMRFDGLPRAARATRRPRLGRARRSARLWDWLVDVHELGRPRDATPPA